MSYPETNSFNYDPRARISTLWVVLLFNMAFADILGFVYPGAIEDLIAMSSDGVNLGGVDGVLVTPEFLLIAAVFIEIAALMIYFSRSLARPLNRAANAIAAILTAIFVVGGGSAKLHYIFFASIEVVILAVILWIVWQWNEGE